MIRVLVADDSATSRQLLATMLESDPEIRAVGQATNGVEAVEMVTSQRPDLIVMDVHMPVMDGLEATREIMSRSPLPIIIVSSASRYRDIDMSLSATQAGALMMLPKPVGPTHARFDDNRRELVGMVKALAHVKVVRHWSTAGPAKPPSVREPSPGSIDLIAIAASTGGPPALRNILAGLDDSFHIPVVIVQHIAQGFTAGFAHWLDADCKLSVQVAREGESLQRGRVYVAPDDQHVLITRNLRISLSKAPQVNGFRPSADLLFESMASYGPRAACVILSGMGTDGARGLVTAHQAGSFVIAQDEATSVVFGMAQEAINKNAVDLVLPIERIGAKLQEIARKSLHG